MHPDVKKSKIEDFWTWFVTMEPHFKKYFEDDPLVDKEFLVESMNNRVLDFGMFSWQIGPGEKKPFFLTISPNGNQERLDLSKSIIRAAPLLEDWELHFAKPAKDWDFQLVLYDNFMRECNIDVGQWQYLLMRKPGNRVDIFLELTDIGYIDPETQHTAVDIAITNILGEQWKIRYVNKVAILSEDSPVTSRERTSIKHLKKEFEKTVVL